MKKRKDKVDVSVIKECLLRKAKANGSPYSIHEITIYDIIAEIYQELLEECMPNMKNKM